MKRALALTSALFSFWLSPESLHADALPLERSVRIGRPARSVDIRVDAHELSVRSGSHRDRAALPVSARDASVETVEVAAGHHVAIVRTRGEGETAALIALSGGRARILWSGRTDPHGDPGEQRAFALSLEDRTGDGFADVVVGLVREGASLCGEEGTLLAPRAFDPTQGTLRPVILRRISSDARPTAVTASRESPGPSGPPLLDALRFSGASSTAGRDEHAPGTPRALSDGDPATFWAEGRGGPGAGEFVVAHFGAGFPIRAFAIRTATGAGEALGRPRRFWLVGDEGPPVQVTMSEDPGSHPGERYWITLPEPQRWRCVALVLDEAYVPSGTPEAAVRTGFAELEAYTELDFGGGLDALVAILVEGREGGDEAARLLGGLGAPGVGALAAAWERLDETGKRRAVRAFTEAARRDAEGALEALAQAAREESESVRGPALEALGRIEGGAAVLAALVREPGTLGEQAVRSLVRHPPKASVPPLLAALSDEGGSERPALREGLATALSRADDEVKRAFEAWTLEERSPRQLASAALALAMKPATRALAAPLLSAAAPEAERFEDRWRLALAAAELEADPEVDAWLSNVSSSAEEWMLRAQALEALTRRGSERRVESARRALADPYPRVRMAAVEALASAGEETAELARLARRDSWPMVREAAVRALAEQPEAREVLRAAVHDRSARVRKAAIGALRRAQDRAAWPLVRARLLDRDEWPQVMAEGLEYVRDLCIEEADDAVVALIRRGLRPGPWPPDVDVAALAVDVALTLGGEAAEQARQVEAREDAPASMRAAARRRADLAPGCGAAVAR